MVRFQFNFTSSLMPIYLDYWFINLDIIPCSSWSPVASIFDALLPVFFRHYGQEHSNWRLRWDVILFVLPSLIHCIIISWEWKQRSNWEKSNITHKCIVEVYYYFMPPLFVEYSFGGVIWQQWRISPRISCCGSSCSVTQCLYWI